MGVVGEYECRQSVEKERQMERGIIYGCIMSRFGKSVVKERRQRAWTAGDRQRCLGYDTKTTNNKVATRGIERSGIVELAIQATVMLSDDDRRFGLRAWGEDKGIYFPFFPRASAVQGQSGL
jgi:hypothetical protein